MAKIQIICSSPGMRRMGKVHPATAIYSADVWTDKQLDAFRADPAFTIREVSETENVRTDDDFEIRVANEVEARLQEKADELQRAFDQAVTEKAQERVDELEAKVTDLTAKLEAAAKAADGEAKPETKTTTKSK